VGHDFVANPGNAAEQDAFAVSKTKLFICQQRDKSLAI
jgi:hypothetical protein